MRALGVARVSTKEQASDAHFSFLSQRTRIEDYCNQHHWDLVDVKQYVQSGGSNQRELRQILARVSEDRIEVVVVAELDRLARDMVSTMLFLEDLQHVHCRFASVADGLDLTTPDGELHMMLLAMFAHYFRKQLSRKVRAGQAERPKQGRRHGRRPYGYRPDGDRWAVDDDEAPVVRQVFQWYVREGLGVRAIAQRLNTEHVPGHSGHIGSWDAATIQRMLRREAYVGAIIYQKWHTERDRDGGVHQTRQAPLIIPDAHPAIIDPETWEATQTRLAVRQAMGRHVRQSASSPYLLSGLVRCGSCNTSMVAIRTGPRQADGTRRPVYICRAYQSKGTCSTATRIPVADVDGAVLSALHAELAQAQAQPSEEQVRQWLADDPTVLAAATARRRLDQRLVQVERMLARAEEMALQGVYTIDEFQVVRQRLRTEYHALLSERNAAPALSQALDPHAVTERLRQHIRRLEETLQAPTVMPSSRAWLQSMVESVTCNPGRRIAVAWRSPLSPPTTGFSTSDGQSAQINK